MKTHEYVRRFLVAERRSGRVLRLLHFGENLAQIDDIVYFKKIISFIERTFK